MLKQRAQPCRRVERRKRRDRERIDGEWRAQRNAVFRGHFRHGFGCDHRHTDGREREHGLGNDKRRKRQQRIRCPQQRRIRCRQRRIDRGLRLRRGFGFDFAIEQRFAEPTGGRAAPW